ncbi:hypothetical protein GCM10009111_34910 [Colwellia asteriadis]|uniref:Uncharacterized protein n=1 Tax=Colwellia asteriadis TaxID=517723 RepID=A0ABN1LC06_9GAMM
MQPSIVTSVDSHLNRIVSRLGYELIFDDHKLIPKITLQTLAGEHYIEFNAHKKAEHDIQWISRLGDISFHAGTSLMFDTEEGNINVSCEGYQHIDAKNSVNIAEEMLLESVSASSYLTERALHSSANNNIAWQTEQGDLSITATTSRVRVNRPKHHTWS